MRPHTCRRPRCVVAVAAAVVVALPSLRRCRRAAVVASPPSSRRRRRGAPPSSRADGGIVCTLPIVLAVVVGIDHCALAMLKLLILTSTTKVHTHDSKVRKRSQTTT